LAGYGATLADLVAALDGGAMASSEPVDLGPSDEELIRSLTEAIRRVEGRQVETESRVERLEKGLGQAAG
jgi:hypothetical protein